MSRPSMTNRTIAIRSFFRGLGWRLGTRLMDALLKGLGVLK